MRDQVTKDQWADWKLHPVTVAFFEQITAKREEYIQFLAQGGFSNSISKQNLALGSINAYTLIMGADFEGE